ncbi:hypothetical protein [Pedobacter sp. GR22-6]|uniref:hypothetical protein n=1 Tax=Pedobacter sp. GR22-6 TaxID=3127957 RepID=UPI00307FBE8F
MKKLLEGVPGINELSFDLQLPRGIGGYDPERSRYGKNQAQPSAPCVQAEVQKEVIVICCFDAFPSIGTDCH